MSEKDRKTEELEEELEEGTEEDEDASASGEVLYIALKERGLVDDPWADLSKSEKSKYQEVADEVM